MHPENPFAEYLAPTYFIDADHPDVIAFTHRHIRPEQSPVERAVSLYYAIRDGFRYNPYNLYLQPEAFKASTFLQRSEGHCIDKANLLAACARAAQVPARLGFANVTNHIGTEKVEKALGTNVLVFHGFTELFLNGQWLKATPAFNKALCEKLHVAPLEFDGKTDSVFQQYSTKGDKFMEYLHDYGTFADLPHSYMISEWRRHYPKAFRGETEIVWERE